jgi:adenosylmethionine-8-amino-7-oxononanoate aminotransferase
VTYPCPVAGVETSSDELLSQFQEFLDRHGDEIGVLLVEPQWGSSQAALPWPKDLVKQYILLAKERGIKIVCDEIMCGLGRHGEGTLFLSDAWDLDPDAVTFGKAIGGGVYPLSGAILKQGRDQLRLNKATVMQSHTYAGSSTRALMTGTEVLKILPSWLPSISKLDVEMKHIFRFITRISEGMILCHGKGLLWGGVFSREGQNQDESFRQRAIAVFKKYCEQVGVLPYHVPIGGFMVTPVIDIDVGSIYEIGERLEEAVRKTMAEVGWITRDVKSELFIADITLQSSDKCHPFLHETKSCTSCSSFVCSKVRTRFLNV